MNKKQSLTEQLNSWIKEHGDARNALNVALARLESAEAMLEYYKGENKKLSDEQEARCRWRAMVDDFYDRGAIAP